MSYLALYRKLRPQTFDNMVGQQHIVKTLKNQIENNRISHAYLFCGTRGTGKTSAAKIFARAVNCEAEDNRPCNNCRVCKNILSGNSINVVEIDAASNNGVDNIREITEDVKYPPTEGRYKVYIIDEVHMLSTGAFNALLKTLEEPPAHAIFILATTDPQKLPVTVLSRCQRFDFHRISTKEMTEALAKYMQEEGVDIEKDALDYIAEISDGAMRDALSILDQCMSFYYGETVTRQKVTEITGSVDRETFFELTTAIVENDAAKAMDIVDNIVTMGRDISQFTGEYVRHLRDMLVAVSVQKQSSALDYAPEYVEKLKTRGDTIPYDYLLELIELFSQLQNQLRYSQSPRIILEVCIIKACTPVHSHSDGALEKRLINIEKQLEKGIAVTAAPNVQAAPVEEEKKEQPVINKAVPDDIKTMIRHWKKFLASVEDKEVKVRITNDVYPAYLEDNYLTMVCDYDFHVDLVNGAADKIKKELKRFSDRDFEVRAMTREKYNIRHTELYGGKDSELPEKTEEESLAALNIDINFKEDM